MIAFIDEQRAVHGVEPICKGLPIAPSTYHSHVARRTDPSRAPARWRSDAELSVAIQRIWNENSRSTGYGRSGGSYGGKGLTWRAARWPG